jgi:CcmD family protein
MIHSVTNLYIAYAATWVIHIGYLLFLGAKARKLREEAREFANQVKQ